MADISQLRKNDPVDRVEDDPFAELTRIMGFDPREAVKKPEPKPASLSIATAPVAKAAEPEAVSVEEASAVSQAEIAQLTAAEGGFEPAAALDGDLALDFEIDLEKELMGDFALEFDAPEAAAPAVTEAAAAPAVAEIAVTAAQPATLAAPVLEAAPVHASSAIDDFAIDLERELEGDIAADLARPDPVATPVVPRPIELAGTPFASAQVESPQPAVVAASPVAVVPETLVSVDDFAIDLERELDFDFATAESEPAWTPSVAEVHVQPVVAPVIEAAEPEVESAVNSPVQTAPAAPFAAASAPVDDDFGFDLERELDSDFAAALAAQPAATIEVTSTPVRPVADELFDESFFDLDLASDERAQAPALAVPSAAAIRMDMTSQVEDHTSSAHPLDDLDFDLDADIGTETADTLDATPMPASQAAIAPVKNAPTIEDELAALLGSLTSKAPAPSAETTRWTSRANHVAPAAAPAPAPSSYLAAAHVPAAPVAADARSAIDQDLDALLRVMTAEVHAPFAPAAAPVFERTPITTREAPTYDNYAQEQEAAPQDEVFDFDTVDVPEPAYAYADDLDLPEITFDEPELARAAYDDYASDYVHPHYADNAPATPAPSAYGSAQRADFDTDFDALYRQVREAAGAPAFAPAAAYPSDNEYAAADNDGDLQLYDDDEVVMPSTAAMAGEPPRRRGVMLAAVVGGVALLGAVGAFALSYGGGSGGSSVPVIVQADNDPIKVRPENPGGTTVPNQDSKVFETMARSDASVTAAPSQETLVSAEEEPLDISAGDPDAEPEALAAKGEDRIDPETAASTEPANEELVAIAPRKVKTMVVKADGTLVPREEVVAAAAPTSALAPAAGNSAAAPVAESVPAVSAETVATTPVSTAPATADQLALAVPAAGSWSMQIASQPSAESAQATYDDLAKRYGGVIGGKGVNIVKAEIAGKGTYWRVRVPAATKNDAIGLCESYKAAGGNCFVSR